MAMFPVLSKCIKTMYLEKERGGMAWNCTNSKENFPMWIINIWKELPENVVMSPNVNTFKNRLDKHWSTEHFLYDYSAAIPGHNGAEFNDDLTTEAPRLQSFTS